MFGTTKMLTLICVVVFEPDWGGGARGLGSKGGGSGLRGRSPSCRCFLSLARFRL